jgi:micrococcal nuclease
MKYLAFLIFIITPLTFACKGNKSGNYISSGNGKENKGKVIAIIDGDTYDILEDGNQTVRIRMEGIDAPEKGMPFYRVAKNYLGKLCFEKNVRLEVTGKDNHGRTLAFSFLDDGSELSHEMIKAGLAWHFKKYSSDSVLSNLEIEARNSKLGLWADIHPMPPWKNRRLHREGISTKDSFKYQGKL